MYAYVYVRVYLLPPRLSLHYLVIHFPIALAAHCAGITSEHIEEQLGSHHITFVA